MPSPSTHFVTLRLRTDVAEKVADYAARASVSLSTWSRAMMQHVMDEHTLLATCQRFAPLGGLRQSVRSHPELRKDTIVRFSLPKDIDHLLTTMAGRGGWKSPEMYRSILMAAVEDNWPLMEEDDRLRPQATSRRVHLSASVPTIVYAPAAIHVPAHYLPNLARVRVHLTVAWLRSTRDGVASRAASNLVLMTQDMQDRWYGDREEETDMVHFAYHDTERLLATIIDAALPNGFHPQTLVSMLATAAVLEFRSRLAKGV